MQQPDRLDRKSSLNAMASVGLKSIPKPVTNAALPKDPVHVAPVTFTPFTSTSFTSTSVTSTPFRSTADKGIPVSSYAFPVPSNAGPRKASLYFSNYAASPVLKHQETTATTAMTATTAKTTTTAMNSSHGDTTHHYATAYHPTAVIPFHQATSATSHPSVYQRFTLAQSLVPVDPLKMNKDLANKQVMHDSLKGPTIDAHTVSIDAHTESSSSTLIPIESRPVAEIALGPAWDVYEESLKSAPWYKSWIPKTRQGWMLLLGCTSIILVTLILILYYFVPR